MVDLDSTAHQRLSDMRLIDLAGGVGPAGIFTAVRPRNGYR